MTGFVLSRHLAGTDDDLAFATKRLELLTRAVEQPSTSTSTTTSPSATTARRR